MAGFVFVSYSDEDRAYAERLAQYLGGHGIAAWFDYRMVPGEPIDAKIQTAITDSMAVVVLLSPAYLSSAWMTEGTVSFRGKPVLALLLEDCELPADLAALPPADVRGGRLPAASFVAQVRGFTGVPAAVTGMWPVVSAPVAPPAVTPAPPADVDEPAMAGAAVGAAGSPAAPAPSTLPPARVPAHAAPVSPAARPLTTDGGAAATVKRWRWLAVGIVVLILLAGAGALAYRGGLFGSGAQGPPEDPRPGQVTTFTVLDSDGTGGVGLDQRLSFSLTAPSSPVPIERYELDYTGDDAVDATSTSTSGYLTGLTNGTTYLIRVRACAQLCGPWSITRSGRPYGPVPAPTAEAVKEGDRQIRFSWTPPPANGRELATLQIRVDDGAWEDVAAADGSRTVGNGPTQTHTIEVRAVDQAGQTSPVVTASATTNGSTVIVAHGAPCGANCFSVVVTLDNFAANTGYTCMLNSSTGGLGNYNVTTDANGNFSGQSSYQFGQAAGWVSATCNGVTGTRQPWV